MSFDLQLTAQLVSTRRFVSGVASTKSHYSLEFLTSSICNVPDMSSVGPQLPIELGKINFGTFIEKLCRAFVVFCCLFSVRSNIYDHACKSIDLTLQIPLSPV